MILSDDVSGDDSIDDGTECDGDNVEQRESDLESAAGDDHCCSEWTLLTAVFIGQDKTQWGGVR